MTYKTYIDEAGNTLPRHLALDAAGCLRSGVTVRVPQVLADGGQVSLVTPRKASDAEQAAYDAYANRFNRRKSPADAKASPADAEQAAYTAHAARYSRKGEKQ